MMKSPETQNEPPLAPSFGSMWPGGRDGRPVRARQWVSAFASLRSQPVPEKIRAFPFSFEPAVESEEPMRPDSQGAPSSSVWPQATIEEGETEHYGLPAPAPSIPAPILPVLGETRTVPVPLEIRKPEDALTPNSMAQGEFLPPHPQTRVTDPPELELKTAVAHPPAQPQQPRTQEPAAATVHYDERAKAWVRPRSAAPLTTKPGTPVPEKFVSQQRARHVAVLIEAEHRHAPRGPSPMAGRSVPLRQQVFAAPMGVPQTPVAPQAKTVFDFPIRKAHREDTSAKGKTIQIQTVQITVHRPPAPPSPVPQTPAPAGPQQEPRQSATRTLNPWFRHPSIFD